MLQTLANKKLHTGFSYVYNLRLGHSLRRIYRRHHRLFEEAASRGDKGETR